MKNVFKARSVPLIGIIAFTVIIGFTMIGCDDSDSSSSYKPGKIIVQNLPNDNTIIFVEVYNIKDLDWSKNIDEYALNYIGVGDKNLNDISLPYNEFSIRSAKKEKDNDGNWRSYSGNSDFTFSGYASVSLIYGVSGGNNTTFKLNNVSFSNGIATIDIDGQ